MKRKLLANFTIMASVLLSPVFAQSAAAVSTYVIMRGGITSYSVEPTVPMTSTNGWCGVYAMVGGTAHVLMAWPSGNPSVPEIYHFYTAVLVNTTLVALDYSGPDFYADLYIQGSWNVHNVTFVYEPGGGRSVTDILLVDNGTGTLSVTGNWQSFAAEILGAPPLVVVVNGLVTFHAVRSAEIPIGDVSGSTIGDPDGKIDILDLVHAARAYGATPGDPNLQHPRYDFSLDFDLDYRIDIIDLTTIAVNIGKSY
jgi:hypothetical protein